LELEGQDIFDNKCTKDDLKKKDPIKDIAEDTEEIKDLKNSINDVLNNKDLNKEIKNALKGLKDNIKNEWGKLADKGLKNEICNTIKVYTNAKKLSFLQNKKIFGITVKKVKKIIFGEKKEKKKSKKSKKK
jgi:hypothetical protein